MNILQVTTSTKGGAGIACLRLHRQLRLAGQTSKVLCLKDSAGASATDADITPVINKKNINSIPGRILLRAWEWQLDRRLRNRPGGYEVFSSSWSYFDMTRHAAYREADIVHLHWTASFLDHRNFFRKNEKPIVFTLHDMFPFTGGCHHSDGCMKYTNDCDHCPQLKGTPNDSYAASQLAIKTREVVPGMPIHIVSPSAWLKRLSEKSRVFSAFPHSHIPNGTDQNIFTIRDKRESRQKFGLPQDKPILLFAAESINNHRKGFHLLLEALRQITTEVTLVAMGANTGNMSLPSSVVSVGRINDPRVMSQCYNAADGFVLPSLAENLPNTIVESLLCGTPVTAFSVGGITEMIRDGENGYLCRDLSVNSLAGGMRALLSMNGGDREAIRKNAVGKYALEEAAAKYISIYRQMLQYNTGQNKMTNI